MRAVVVTSKILDKVLFTLTKATYIQGLIQLTFVDRSLTLDHLLQLQSSKSFFTAAIPKSNDEYEKLEVHVNKGNLCIRVDPSAEQIEAFTGSLRYPRRGSSAYVEQSARGITFDTSNEHERNSNFKLFTIPQLFIKSYPLATLTYLPTFPYLPPPPLQHSFCERLVAFCRKYCTTIFLELCLISGESWLGYHQSEPFLLLCLFFGNAFYALRALCEVPKDLKLRNWL